MPLIDEFVEMSNYCFYKGEVLAMERSVLQIMSYNIALPTRIYFLNRFLLAAQVDDVDNMSDCTLRSNHHLQLATEEKNYKEASFAYFIMDITLQNYGFNMYPMSLVAAAIVHYVKQYYRPLNEVLWTPTLAFYTGYAEKHLIPVVYAIQEFHVKLFNTGFMSILKKYNCDQFRYCCAEMSLTKTRIRFDDVAAKNEYLQNVNSTKGGAGSREDPSQVDRSNMTPTCFEKADGEEDENGKCQEGIVDYK